jgi:hypothetical protein
MGKIKRPTQNWSPLPHQLVEEIMAEISALSEFKVIIYILRHTWGFHESEKPITLDEFENGRKRKDGTRMDKGCGMSRNAIKSGIKRAIEHGYIERTTDETDKARIKNTYNLSFEDNHDETISNSESQLLTPRESTIDPQLSEVDPRTEKETIERNIKKKKPLSSKADSDNKSKESGQDKTDNEPDKPLTLPADKEQPLTRKEISTWALVYVWGLEPLESKHALHGYMLGRWMQSIQAIHKAYDTKCCTRHLELFKDWWEAKYKDADLPQNHDKIKIHYDTFYTENRAKHVKSQPTAPQDKSPDKIEYMQGVME